MFTNPFRRIAELEQSVTILSERNLALINRLDAIEDYLNIDFFAGSTQKPHYRKRKIVVKKIGRPRKNKTKKLSPL